MDARLARDLEHMMFTEEARETDDTQCAWLHELQSRWAAVADELEKAEILP